MKNTPGDGLIVFTWSSDGKTAVCVCVDYVLRKAHILAVLSLHASLGKVTVEVHLLH